jgi:hypothetical protein
MLADNYLQSSGWLLADIDGITMVIQQQSPPPESWDAVRSPAGDTWVADPGR